MTLKHTCTIQRLSSEGGVKRGYHDLYTDVPFTMVSDIDDLTVLAEGVIVQMYKGFFYIDQDIKASDRIIYDGNIYDVKVVVARKAGSFSRHKHCVFTLG